MPVATREQVMEVVAVLGATHRPLHDGPHLSIQIWAPEGWVFVSGLPCVAGYAHTASGPFFWGDVLERLEGGIFKIPPRLKSS